ncbi:exosortase C-terminal domain/associated protein EpsI [Psychromonas sp. MME2]|uniref:exosortase C-terminal domain/associated protein EpsI n=1 Tax=unclassified Psychromonas TaxID=2614957 RepID=UPI00339CCB3C
MWAWNRITVASFFLLNFLLLLIINSSAVFEVFDEWWSTGPYNHGLLGLAVAMYIIWQKKDIFAEPQVNHFSLLLLCASNLLLFVANIAAIGQLQIASLFLVLLSLLASFWGFKIVKKLFLPLAMILLILPIWSIIQLPLRSISTWVSFHLVDLLNFEIIRNGYELLTPGGTFIVEEACSGLGFFLASALYALFVAQINHLSRKAGILFFFIAITVAIIANWIRISTIIIVGSQTAMQHFIVQDHLTFGWLVFAGCFIPVIIIGNTYFGEQKVDKVDIVEKIKTTESLDYINKWYLLGIPTIIIAFAVCTHFISSNFDPKYKFVLPNIPHYKLIVINKAESHNWFPLSIGAANEEFSYYSQNENLIQVYLANYVRQQQGAEMIFVGNRLFDKNRWVIVDQKRVTLNHSKLQQINLITLRKNSYRSRIIAYWYYVDGRFVADKKQAKWHELLAALKGKPGASLVAIAFDYNSENEQSALKATTDFAVAFANQPIHIETSQ